MYKRLVWLNPASFTLTAGQGVPGLHLQRAALRHRGDEPRDSPHLRRKQERHGETKERYCSLGLLFTVEKGLDVNYGEAPQLGSGVK